MPISAKTTTKSTTTTIKTTIKSTTATTVKPSQIKTLKSTTNKKKSHNKLKHLPKVVKPTLPKVTKSKSKPSQRKKKLPPKAYHKKTYQGKFEFKKSTIHQPILYTINLILFCPFDNTITVDLCRSSICKVTSCQSWMLKKNSASRSPKGPFKYYVIKILTLLNPTQSVIKPYY